MTDLADTRQAVPAKESTLQSSLIDGVPSMVADHDSSGKLRTQSPCRGVLFVLVGPSAAGKNTLMEKVIESVQGLRQMPTATTRMKRGNESHGKQHYFMSVPEFKKLIAEDAFFEHQEVHEGKFYGTLRSEIETAFYKNHEMLIADIDIYGASALKKALGADVILIFVQPPTMEILEQRLRKRAAQDNVPESEILIRLERARLEMPFAAACDFVVINNEIGQATNDVISLVTEQARLRGCL